MKHVEQAIIVVRAQIDHLRFMRSGAFAPGVARIASTREEVLERELRELETQKSSDVDTIGDDELPHAAGFSLQPKKTKTEKEG